MGGPPKDNNEKRPTDTELLEDLTRALDEYKINDLGKKAIISAIMYRRPGRLTFILDQSEEGYVDVDASKTESDLTDEIFDLLIKLDKMMYPGDLGSLNLPPENRDEIVVSFEAAKLQ